MFKKASVLVLSLFMLVTLSGCVVEKVDQNGNPITPIPTETPVPSAIDLTGLEKVDLVVGSGAAAVAGDKIKVHYTGTLTDGTKFDSSVDRGTPYEFTLGQNEVIAGWDYGVPGMQVGGKRKLTIPANLAYGERAQGLIPANSILIFEVELLEIVK